MEYDSDDDFSLDDDKKFKEREKERERRRRNEPTGEAETLIGRKLPRFGDLAQREKIPRTYLDRRKNEEKAFGARKIKGENRYNPKTKDTQSIYEDIIIMVQKYLSDQPPEYVNSAVNEIIPFIKKTDVSKEDKMIFLKNILGKEIANEEINKFILLCKGLLDYNVEENESGNQKNLKKNYDQEMEINMNLDIDEEVQKNDDLVQATTCLEIEEQEKSDDENIIQTNKNVINNEDSELNLDSIINDISFLKKY